MPDSYDQPAMPEREMWWLNPEEDGTMIVVDHPVASFPLAIRLVPESRLREVEAERDEDLSFLLARAMQAGAVGFTEDRWTGASSNYLVAVCYGHQSPATKPGDESDLRACERTWERLPMHRRTEAGRALLDQFRAILARRGKEGA